MTRQAILARFPAFRSRRSLRFLLSVALASLFVVLLTSSQAQASSLDVRDYGAKGDGITDDSRAIQAAVDAAAGGGTVTFPAGTFALRSSVYLRSNVTLQGLPGQTVLLMPAQSSQTFILDGSSLSNVSISGLTLRSIGYSARVSGLYLVGAQNCRASQLRLEGLWYGMKLGSGSPARGWTVSDIVARNCLDPLYVSYVSDSSFRNLDLQAVKISSNQYHAVYLERECRRLTFTNCTFSGGSGYTLHLYLEGGSSSDLTFTNLTLDSTNGRYPLVIGSGFSNVRFATSTLRAGSSGQVALFYGGDDVTFDTFTASGGNVLVSVEGRTSNILFRNGTYSGPDLGSGATFENVKIVTPAGAPSASKLPSWYRSATI